MKELLVLVSEHAIVLIDALALLVVVAGSLEAFWKGLRVVATSGSGHQRRDVWLRYARWLVAALTFQLAADIIESSISTSWESVGRLAAVAAVRTFLNYFLERDLGEIRELQHTNERATKPHATGSEPQPPT
jgi:uncharacterized membrane protein